MVQAGAINAAALVARQIIADADEIEEARRFPATVTEALIASGMLRMLLPKVYGGGEVDPGTYLQAVIALAKGDGSVAWNVFVANSAALIALFLPETSARAIFDDPAALIAWGPPSG